MIVVSYIALVSILLIFISQLPQVVHVESVLFYSDLIKIIAKEINSKFKLQDKNVRLAHTHK